MASKLDMELYEISAEVIEFLENDDVGVKDFQAVVDAADKVGLAAAKKPAETMLENAIGYFNNREILAESFRKFRKNNKQAMEAFGL